MGLGPESSGEGPGGQEARKPGGESVDNKKAALAGGFLIWRLPTLAEPIEPLPSAALRLTAEFGMGSGRTAALRPPEKLYFKRAPAGKDPGRIH